MTGVQTCALPICFPVTIGGLANVVMFEMGMPGGQITGSSEIENYPGQGAVMTGMDLMASWPGQCQKFGLKHEMAQVENITKNGDTFKILTNDNREFEAKAVLMATGSVPRRAGFKGEDEFLEEEFLLVKLVMDFSIEEKKLRLLVVEIQL